MESIDIITKKPKNYKAARLEFLFPRTTRLKLIKIFGAFFFLALLIYLISIGLELVFNFSASSLIGKINALIIINRIRLIGAVIFSFVFLLANIVLEFYFLSTSRPAPFAVKQSENGQKIYSLDFGGARRAFKLGLLENELVHPARMYIFFRKSQFMKILPLRLGISPTDLENFIKNKKEETNPPPIVKDLAIKKLIEEADLSGSQIIGAKEFALWLFDSDKSLENFLFGKKIRKEEFRGASEWSARSLEEERKNSRWWEKKFLGRIPSLGKGLSYGYTFYLEKYSNEIGYNASKKIGFLGHQKELTAIEEILSKTAEANVVLVGNEGIGKNTIISGLAQMIYEGKVMPALEHKRLLSLDTTSLIAASKTKNSLEETFEETFIKIMNEATAAGNIILIIDNFSEFVESASKLGVDAPFLLEPYLAGSSLQVIALDETEAFHRTAERRQKIMKLFSKLNVEEPSGNEIIGILSDIAETLERKTGVIITYQTLKSAWDLADRFITEGAMPEKAIDLLDRAASASDKNKAFLMPEDLEKIIESDFKIPIGQASEKESEKLIKMEEILHKRVVGQNEALKAVADALRKTRAGLHGNARPIGSFLFLGPTGVGKTETAKALAATYFGSENNMARFDMSEFQSDEGLEKLIGSYLTGSAGALANSLREKPFGILLFDEFEKSSKQVINLFLQILEEGFFKDAFGKKVSVKDSIIIATSNAGNNVIWDMVKAGKDPATLTKEVIDFVRRDGILSPEILNRFDAVVVYHPLSKEQLKEVSAILLQELARQLKEHDINFEITDNLIAKIAEIGYDPIMGARPMRRAISDRLEHIIAKKILEKRLNRGDTFRFNDDEVALL